MRRAVDVLAGLLLSLVALPMIVVLAIVCTIQLRAWPFFVQERVGQGGRTFRFVKLRTLPKTFAPYARKYDLDEGSVPRVCRAIRRRHLDELPQLFLIPLGHMSLVGPRPEMPGLAAEFDPRFARLRTRFRPGCTGLWQVSDRCTGMIGEAPEFDEYYPRHQNARLDLWIFLRTVDMYLRRRTISLHDIPAWALRPDRAPALETRTSREVLAAEA